MTARFAGSRQLDDRRRRRLAQETTEELLEQASSSRNTRNSLNADGSPSEAELEPTAILRSSLPRSPWKLAALVLLATSAWGGMLALGLARWPREIGWEKIVDLQSGSLPRLLSILMTFFAAQLAYSIYWHRAQSRKDFLGRYRLWAWLSVLWGITCLCVGTGIHRPLAELVYARWPLNCWRPEVLYWLAPLATGMLAMHRLLGREVRQSRLSDLCWQGSFLLGGIAGCLQLGLELWFPEQWRTLLALQMVAAWQCAVVIALLVHARYVVHVTREAPPKIPSLSSRVFRMLRTCVAARLPVRASRSSAAPRKTAKPIKEKVAAKKAAPVAEQQPPAAEKPVTKPVVSQPAATPPVARPVAEDKQPSKASAAAEPVESAGGSWKLRLKKRVLGQTLRVDAGAEAAQAPAPEPVRQAPPAPSPSIRNVQPKSQPVRNESYEDDDEDDDDEDSRLSRKERKRMKKQQRQQSRMD